jgi:hypothetical protein
MAPSYVQYILPITLLMIAPFLTRALFWMVLARLIPWRWIVLSTGGAAALGHYGWLAAG